MRKIPFYILALIIAVIFTAGCGKSKGQAAARDKADIVPVKVVAIKKENVNKVLEYVGNIEGQDEALVYPKVSGKIIEKVKEDGAEIKKGEPICFIDRDEVGLRFEMAPVESPLDGIVGRVYVDLGSSVNPQTAVALVTDVDRVEIKLNIPEAYLPGITIGQQATVTVDAYPDEVFNGEITKISPVVEKETRAAPIEITVDNPDHRLQSGMFGRVRIIMSLHKDVPVVMKEAILGKGAQKYVYVVENGKAVLKDIKLGIRQGPFYEVLEGLNEGDMVVIMGQQRLKDGSRVTAEEDQGGV